MKCSPRIHPDNTLRAGPDGTHEPELFIGADYSLAELYSLAQLCKVKFGFSVLGDTLNTGVDVHLVTAGKLFLGGATHQDVSAHPKKKSLRNGAKAYNFGVPGGLGGPKLVIYAKGYGVTLQEQEARDGINAFKYQVYPEIGMYLDDVGNKGYPWTLVHPITGFVRGGLGYCDGANTGFQHLTAWYAKTATARVAAARWDETSPLYDFKLVNMVHDELICRGPASRASEAADELSRIMVEAANEVLVDYPISAGPWVSNVWSKHNEECKRGPDGRWVPWNLEEAIARWRAVVATSSDPGANQDKIKSAKSALVSVGATW